MFLTFKTVGLGILNLMMCMALSTQAFAVDWEVYKKPNVEQRGTTISGKVVRVDVLAANLQR